MEIRGAWSGRISNTRDGRCQPTDGGRESEAKAGAQPHTAAAAGQSLSGLSRRPAARFFP